MLPPSANANVWQCKMSLSRAPETIEGTENTLLRIQPKKCFQKDGRRLTCTPSITSSRGDELSVLVVITVTR